MPSTSIDSMSAKGKVSLAVMVVSAFIAGIFFTTAGANIFDFGDKVTSESHAGDTTINQDFQGVANLENAFTAVSESVNPTVVQIRPEQVVEGQRNPFGDHPFFERFFGQPDHDRGPNLREGLGSGVIIRSNGYIITNNHVIEDADDITVVMDDGTEYDAEVVGGDPSSDLAVIRIDAEGLPVISVGDSEGLRTGQWVLAFGSPLDQSLSNSVTAGIVSAKGRLRAMGQQQYFDFIQTDAAINPGNSGGPLVNLRGEMVGINTAIISRTGGNVGIGFAIPSSDVMRVIDQIIDEGGVRRGRLGVEFRDAPASLRQAENLPRGAAQIMRVESGSAADDAGLQEGDIVTAVEGQELENHLQLGRLVGNRAPGEDVELTINRDGAMQQISVTLGEMDTNGASRAEAPSRDRSEPGEIEQQLMEEVGFGVRNIPSQVRQQYGIEEGVIISQIDRTSEAFRDASLQRNHIIVSIDGQSVLNTDDFMEAYEAAESGSYLRLTVRIPVEDGGTFRTAVRKP